MALTIQTEILGQEATSANTYCYLYEPLRVVITESDATATKIFIELEILETSNHTTVVENLVNYGEYDINSGQSLSVDLMKLAQQHHDARVYKYSTVSEITDNTIGWHSVVSRYVYKFKITSDITTTATNVLKQPIIGGRAFPDFVATVDSTQDLTEGYIENVDMVGRFKLFPSFACSLVSPTLQDSSPSITSFTSGVGADVCGGFLIWKSRFGGWMSWGFKLKVETQARQYSGNIEGGMFDSTLDVGGNPYIGVDYTGITTSYGVKLKELNLTSEELRAVAGLQASPAVYYMKTATSSLELMRVSSVSAPIDNKANGGDFSVTLKSISQSSQKTR
jgi:hypothetical protein